MVSLSILTDRHLSNERGQGGVLHQFCPPVRGQRLGLCQRCQQGPWIVRAYIGNQQFPSNEWTQVCLHQNWCGGWHLDNHTLSYHFSCFIRFTTKLLEDLVFFLCEVPNNGQEVLSVVISNPNRERQKLMREQNILAQVCSNWKTSIVPYLVTS